MKKRVLALMFCAALMAAGCGSKNNAADKTEPTEAVEMTADKNGTETAEKLPEVTYESPSFQLKSSELVKLGDVKKIPVTIVGDFDVDDQEVTDYFEQMFNYYGPFYKEDTEKKTVGAGDIVNIDYVGKLDGEEFEGGKAENQNIDVDNNASASGSGFIDGFTDGLKGASVGDVIDHPVTFPEDYPSENLAGKEAVFTFTVNSIQKEIQMEDVDDAFAKEQFDADTVEDMYAQIRQLLESTKASSKEQNIYAEIQDYLLENCKVDVPEDYLTARLNDFEKQFVLDNCEGDAEKLEQFITDNYGTTLEEARGAWRDGMTNSISMELITDALADHMKIEIDEKGFETYIKGLLANGYASEDELYKKYGYNDTAYGQTYLRKIYRGNMALKELKEDAKVTIEAPAEETEAVEPTEQEAAEPETTEALEVKPEETEAVE